MELTLIFEFGVSEVSPNEPTLVSSLSACVHLGALDQGKWVRAYADKIGAKISVTLGTAFIDTYVKCGSIENGAYEVFKRMAQKDIVACLRAEMCFELFDDMVANGTYPNEIIYVAILSACSHADNVEMGYHVLLFYEMVHEYGIRPSWPCRLSV
ncbi:hypothetical protein ACE6H2_019030 [Prunus campanulata]